MIEGLTRDALIEAQTVLRVVFAICAVRCCHKLCCQVAMRYLALTCASYATSYATPGALDKASATTYSAMLGTEIGYRDAMSRTEIVYKYAIFSTDIGYIHVCCYQTRRLALQRLFGGGSRRGIFLLRAPTCVVCPVLTWASYISLRSTWVPLHQISGTKRCQENPGYVYLH